MAPLRCTSDADDTVAWLAALDVLSFFVGGVTFGIVFLGGRLPLARVTIVVTAQVTMFRSLRSGSGGSDDNKTGGSHSS